MGVRGCYFDLVKSWRAVLFEEKFEEKFGGFHRVQCLTDDHPEEGERSQEWLQVNALKRRS